MAVVSSDHADEKLCAEDLLSEDDEVKLISAEEILKHNGKGEHKSLWSVVDGFVVDASDFLTSHPGGLGKLLSANKARIGATGQPFGFSFSRGRNAHFPDTGKRFREGVARFLKGKGSPVDVKFPPHDGKIVILGRLFPGVK